MPEAAAAALNFKSAAQIEKKDATIKSVHLTGSVALKIFQHCCESDTTGADGQLLGLDVFSVLEVTECFPWLVCFSHLRSPWPWFTCEAIGIPVAARAGQISLEPCQRGLRAV
jgi:hypothetical protein